MIEEEVKRFIQEAYDTAYRILTERKDEWERLAQGLLEYETLTGEEIKRVMRGDPPQANDDEDDKTDKGTAASVTAIPKTKAKVKPAGGLEPEPT
jgi:cell division protease FtsH